MGAVRHEFEATIAEADRGGAYVTVPPDVVAALGGRRRTPVVATFDGVEYRGSVVAMGRGMVIGVLKQIRTRLGKEPGDTLTVTLMVDDKPRRVDVPADLRAAFGGGAPAVALRRALRTRTAASTCSGSRRRSVLRRGSVASSRPSRASVRAEDRDVRTGT